MQVQEWSVQYTDLKENSTWNPDQIRIALTRAETALNNKGFYIDDATSSAEAKVMRDIGIVIEAVSRLGIKI